MSAIQNLHSFDPFADASKGDDLLPAGTEDYIHIRIQQRNGRKTLTTVQGIADDYDKKKLVKAFKKVSIGGESKVIFNLLERGCSPGFPRGIVGAPGLLLGLMCFLLCSCLQKFACNGTVIEHPEYGEVIQLQGDQRKNICQFLVEVSSVHLVRIHLCLHPVCCQILPCLFSLFRRSGIGCARLSQTTVKFEVEKSF
uniref:SUI1 domain-containing protein n=1 Tax=Suricata suricatta TaxID=37032 RepID=A0A673VGG2_SURSU